MHCVERGYLLERLRLRFQELGRLQQAWETQRRSKVGSLSQDYSIATANAIPVDDDTVADAEQLTGLSSRSASCDDGVLKSIFSDKKRLAMWFVWAWVTWQRWAELAMRHDRSWMENRGDMSVSAASLVESSVDWRVGSLRSDVVRPKIDNLATKTAPTSVAAESTKSNHNHNQSPQADHDGQHIWYRPVHVAGSGDGMSVGAELSAIAQEGLSGGKGEMAEMLRSKDEQIAALEKKLAEAHSLLALGIDSNDDVDLAR